jgi:soluble lytic murein transglycosylase-like protein
MPLFSRRYVLALLIAAPIVAGCSREVPSETPTSPPLYPNETLQLRGQINKWADHYEVPRELVHKLAIRESTHRPWAKNPPYYGLLQILPATARSMGFSGNVNELLNADTNLEFAGKYLRGAWLLADGNQDRAIFLYAKGYWPEAKAAGMLVETGLVPE